MPKENQQIGGGQLHYLYALSQRDPVFDHLRKKFTYTDGFIELKCEKDEQEFIKNFRLAFHEWETHKLPWTPGYTLSEVMEYLRILKKTPENEDAIEYARKTQHALNFGNGSFL